SYPIGGILNINGTDYRIVPTPNYNRHAVESKNLYVVFSGVEGAAGGLAGAVNAAPISTQSTVIDVRMHTTVPRKGQDVLNTLFEVYNEFAITDKNQMAAKTLRFIEDRLNMVIEQLDSVERDVSNYKTANNVYDVSSQAGLYLSKVQESDQRRGELDLQLDILASVADYISDRGRRPGVMPSLALINDGALAGLLQRLYDAEATRDKARTVGGEKSDLVLNAEAEVVRLKEAVQQNLATQRANMLTVRNTLNQRIASNSALLRSVPEKEIGLINISRQQSIKNSIYTFLLQKREETALNSASTIADLRVIEYAYAYGPISPIPKNYYMTGLIIGLLLAAGFIAVREQLNRKVLFRQEIEARVGIPVIAELLQLHDKGPIVVNDGKRSAIAEQFRSLRTNLSFIGIDETDNTILLTSSVSGEGKSFTAVNLALSFTLTGKKVALMEIDLRKPKLSKLLGIDRSPGITDYIINKAGFDEVVKPTEYNNLFLVPAGTIPPNPSELLLKERFAELMKEVKEKFDYVIIDTAPIGPVTDAFLLKRFADVTIYMVRHDVT
ncbi:MAG: polysaccharide biosynthesis tyrosine autokinase, partial [Sphingobacteriales bacterium]